MDIALLAGLMGILGGIISGLIVSILSQRKNNAEIKRLEAETRKINTELENVQNNEYREILSKLHEYVHKAVGAASRLTRRWREKPVLAGRSDEDILNYFENSFLSKFELDQLLKVPDKDAYLAEVTTWHEYIDTQNAQVEYHNFLVSKRVFIDDEDLLIVCYEFDELLIHLINITSLNIKKIAQGNLAETYSEYHNKVGPLVDKIEERIRPVLKHKTNIIVGD